MRILSLILLCSVLCGTAMSANLPYGWYQIGGDTGVKHFSVEVVPNGGFKGAAVLVRKTDTNPTGFSGIAQSIVADNYHGKTIRLSASIKTKAVKDGYAGIWLRTDKGKEMQFLDNMSDRGISGDTDWQSYSSVMKVGLDTTRIIFGALLNGSGEMYVDEFSLEIVPDDTPLTTTVGDLEKEPVNMSF